MLLTPEVKLTVPCFGARGDNASTGPVPWSPDGTRLAFQRRVGDDYEIFVMDVDGQDVKQLTDNDWEDGSSAWSLDGSRIAFSACPRPEGCEPYVQPRAYHQIFVVDLESGAVEQITTGAPNKFRPEWRPGRR